MPSPILPIPMKTHQDCLLEAYQQWRRIGYRITNLSPGLQTSSILIMVWTLPSNPMMMQTGMTMHKSLKIHRMKAMEPEITTLKMLGTNRRQRKSGRPGGPCLTSNGFFTCLQARNAHNELLYLLTLSGFAVWLRVLAQPLNFINFDTTLSRMKASAHPTSNNM